MTQPEGTVAYGYDFNGYMDSLTDWRGDTITMTNDPDGRMETVARSNNVDTNYGYDLAGRLTSIGHTVGATVVDSFTYSLDGNGNRVGVTSNTGTESYTLDGLNRITAATYPGAQSETFAYDPAGRASLGANGGRRRFRTSRGAPSGAPPHVCPNGKCFAM